MAETEIATLRSKLTYKRALDLNGVILKPSMKRMTTQVFLPDGYPHTVSKDYMEYQVRNPSTKK